MRRVVLRSIILVMAGLIFLVAPAFVGHLSAEYGDKVMDNFASDSGMRPVVFPHWVHRIRVRCKVCHEDLGFRFMLGSNNITMRDIAEGKYCGACHNGKIAWPAYYCDRCHSGTMPKNKPLIP